TSLRCQVFVLDIHSTLSHSDLFFLFVIRRPPRSTLFPTRRSSDLSGASGERTKLMARIVLQRLPGARLKCLRGAQPRSAKNDTWAKLKEGLEAHDVRIIEAHFTAQ